MLDAIGTPRLNRMRRAFTLVELLVVIAVVAVIIALLLPTLGAAKGAARSTLCLSNQRQLGITLHLYVDESKEWWPVGSFTNCGHTNHFSATWAAVVAHYAPNPYITEYDWNAVVYPNEVTLGYTGLKPNQGVLKCPSDESTNAWAGPTSVSYGYNGHASGMGVNDRYTYDCSGDGPAYHVAFGRVRSQEVRKPSSLVCAADENAQGGYEYAFFHLQLGPLSLATYHSGSANVLWADGHANTRKPENMVDSDFVR